MSKIFIIPSLFIFIMFAGISCGKKWKETTKVECRFAMTKDPIYLTKDDTLTFLSGNMIINEIDFSGDRKQGGNVSFSDIMKSATVLNLGNGTSLPSIHYDIPQGIYESINLTVTAVDENSVPGISFNASFNEEQQQPIPVLFTFESDQIFNIKATDKSGSSEIVLIKGTPATCEITFNVNYWFGNLTDEDFEDATKDTLNGVPTIVVNKTKNQNIYNLVGGRINQSTTAIFK